MQPFPEPAKREKISTAFSAGRPEPLFETDLSRRGTSGFRSYDVSADGRRLLMVCGRCGKQGSPVHVVLDWFEELHRLAPQAPAR